MDTENQSDVSIEEDQNEDFMRDRPVNKAWEESPLSKLDLAKWK